MSLFLVFSPTPSSPNRRNKKNDPGGNLPTLNVRMLITPDVFVAEFSAFHGAPSRAVGCGLGVSFSLCPLFIHSG